jgi:outer membrane receptor protein involved in Fe transport
VTLAAAVQPAEAQFALSSLTGVVTDLDGAGLPGVTVTIRNQATGLVRTTVSAENGRYALTGIQPGVYEASFALDGFRTAESRDVALRVGQEARLDVSLQPGEFEESITVTGENPVIELTTKEIGGTLTAQEFEDLPSQNRSFALFAALLPGVTPAPSTESTSSDTIFVNGQDDNNNSFNVDGANNDDDVIGARAGAQTRTAVEAIQEFQVLTSQFDAEFGRALGGVLNAVTKSGGNSFRGSVFGYFQRASWNEKDFFAERNDLPKPDSEFDSLGFTVGGPILRDRLQFFVSYEDNKDQTGVVGSFSERPELNFSTTEDNHIENVLAKLDYQLAPGHHLAGRFLRETSPQFNQIVGNATLAAAREEDDTDSNWIVTADSVFGQRAVNVARLSFTKEDVAFANPGFNDGGQSFATQRALAPVENRPTVLDGASGVAQARVNRSTQFDDTFSYFLPEWHGVHQVKAGVQYSKREEEFGDFGTANGQFDFDTDRAFDAADLTTYPTNFFLRVGGGLDAPIPELTTWGVFVQDDWSATDRLTLNLGLRWDKENITSDDDDFAPRLGFAWDPFGKGSTVVRGGYGRFYDRFELGAYSGFFLDAVTLSQGFILRVPDAGPNQQLFFDLAQANGVTDLAGLRDVLVRMIEGTAGPVLNTRPTVDNPGRKQSYLDSYSLGIEHEVLPGISVALDLVHNENQDTLLAVDLNPFSSAQGGRPDVSVLDGQAVQLASVTTYVNAGETTYDAAQVSVVKRFDGHFGGRLSYTYADSSGNYGNAGAGTASAYFQTRTETGYDFDRGVIVGAPLDLNLSDPRNDGQTVNWFRRHNAVLSATYRVPKTGRDGRGGVTVSGIFRYMSGDRTTLLSNDRLDNGNRAPAAGGNYDAATPSDIGFDGVRFDGRLFGAETPEFKRLDLSLRYELPLLKDVSVTVLGDVYNATNETNFSGLGGTIVGTGAFLTPNGTYDPGARQYQVGVRVDF